MSNLVNAVHDKINADLDQAIARLQTLLRIPSVSTDPAYANDVRRCAEHITDDLKSIGLEATCHDTIGHPMILATDDSAGPDAPRVLYYGHYDVQPPEPFDEWNHPPFDAEIVDGPNGKRIVARGAADDKGQLMTFIEAIRAWKDTYESLPVRVVILLEGEEESGSESLVPFLHKHKDELQADTCIVCDTGMWDPETPAITSRLRGLVYIEATLHGPTHDLHSGSYGGAVVNPANALTEILGQLHDKDGKIQIEGFYDDVEEVSAEQIAQWNSLGDADALTLESSGSKATFGEQGFSTLERLWSRPTCDINGLRAGYQGEGAKTVIGATATAKISCRLVAHQKPKAIEKALFAFLEERTPVGCHWELKSFGTAPAISVPTQSPWLSAASNALTSVFPKPAVLIGTGGSIPVVGEFQEILGIDAVMVGFSLDDDLIHAPNEKFDIDCFHRGMLAQASILEAYANVHV
jgi:acetylornithine deacetylase/succinyl-diaminopimelate desuccinylase-like protein|tara:strand:- start:5701 stop:7098 length:1398 start_codon:yes stop_codon:yes gene_type:complete